LPKGALSRLGSGPAPTEHAMPTLHERLHFDTADGQVLDGSRRYLLLRVVESAAASLGWGRWRLARDGGSLDLDVRNSPFAAAAAAGTGPACDAIAGMLQALAGLVLGGTASARETACAASTGDGRCRFSARIDPSSPADRPVPAHPKEMKS